MLEAFFHAWERRLASVTKDRIARPFEWGLDWLPPNGHVDTDPAQAIARWVAGAMADTDRFFASPPIDEYRLEDAQEYGQRVLRLTFPSAVVTPHSDNNTVHARYFPSGCRAGRSRRAVLVLPQWNAGEDGHVGLCRLLNRFGMSALRLSLPYHDRRMPPELHRADYIVSSNVVRTVQVCRQAVVDARRALRWLALNGYERIGILGTSLGSCLSLLTAAHEPLVSAQALNHVSPYFADVVWRGLSTAHVRAGLEEAIDLDRLRALWMPISPWAYLDRLRGKKTLLVYARYDLTFPVDLSRTLVREFERRAIPHEVAVLPCGHYSSGTMPFKYVDGFLLSRFLDRSL